MKTIVITGSGSNDAMMLGLNMYGSSKRAVTHFTQALAKESEFSESRSLWASAFSLLIRRERASVG